MQVNVEDLSTVKKVLHIEIPGEEVTRELNDAYKNLKKTAKVKGFRPGKAPRSVLERLYGKNVNADITSKLLQESFAEALKETDLKIIGNPQIDPPELDEKGPYKYDATVEVNPEIEDIEVTGLSLTKNVYNIGEEEVNTQLAMIRKNMAPKEDVKDNRPAQNGDYVTIDYEILKDGESMEDLEKTEGYQMELGTGKIPKEIDEGLVGMEKGATGEFDVTFPEDFQNKKLAGMQVTFKVDLQEIKEAVLPELNDEFAKSLGRFESMDQLTEQVKENLKEGYDKRTEQELTEQIFKTLLEKTDFEVPDVLVDFELQAIIDDAQRSFEYHNTSMEEQGITKEKLEEDYRDTAVKQAKRHLILSKVIDQEKLELTDDEVDAGLKDMAESFQQPFEQVKAFYKQSPDKLEFFKNTLLEKKAVKYIIDKSNLEVVETTSTPAEA